MGLFTNTGTQGVGLKGTGGRKPSTEKVRRRSWGFVGRGSGSPLICNRSAAPANYVEPNMHATRGPWGRLYRIIRPIKWTSDLLFANYVESAIHTHWPWGPIKWLRE